MPTIKEAASEFLANRRVAVTGVSREPQTHASNAVYRRLRERGYEVFAVNPNASEVEGDICYHDLRSIPGGVEAVVIGTRPEIAEETMGECAEHNSSVEGLVGLQGTSAYAASKHGVVGLTKTAALEYAQSGIRVNAVCPGLIRTPMVERYSGGDAETEAQFAAIFEPVGRMGSSEEVAEAVVWLCSEAASFVTGHAMAVDGGYVAR